MSIEQAQNFYNADKHKYQLNTNVELINWLKLKMDNGYYPYMDISELQNTIDTVVSWYEFKYPNYEFENYNIISEPGKNNSLTLSKNMDIQKLMHRLTWNGFSLMTCNYRANGYSQKNIYDNKGLVIGSKTTIGIYIKKNDNTDSFVISADNKTGIVEKDNCKVKNICQGRDITVDEFYRNFDDDSYDLSPLKNCIYNHNTDIELRKKILELVALKLLYSSNTIPTYGYERATRFINEFNKKLSIGLSHNEIDELINDNYHIDDKSNKKDNKILKFIKSFRK